MNSYNPRRVGAVWALLALLPVLGVLTSGLVGCDALEKPQVLERVKADARPQRVLPDLPPEVVEDEKASAQHLLIQYEGAARAPGALLRSKEQARKMAEELAGRAVAPGADFDLLVRQSSEEPGAAQTGGMVGVFRRGELVPPFEEAVFAMKVGQISDAVETVFGYHVIKRVPVEEVHVSHVLVQYAGAQSVRPSVTRTREQALALAQDVRRQALEPGGDFVDLARQYSDCPSAPAGGDLGRFGRGVMVPTFEQAAFATEADHVSEVVETPFGFHVIRRYP